MKSRNSFNIGHLAILLQVFVLHVVELVGDNFFKIPDFLVHDNLQVHGLVEFGDIKCHFQIADDFFEHLVLLRLLR